LRYKVLFNSKQNQNDMVQISSTLKHPVNSKETPFEITGLMKTGYLLLAASLFIYALTEYTGHEKDPFTIFWCHYIVAIIYTVILGFNGCLGARTSAEKENVGFTVILANLYLISAFALNRELHIFWESVDWLCWSLVGSSMTLMSFQYFKVFPSWVNKLQCLLIGSSVVFYTYASIYIGPFYVVGAVTTLALGIGAHVFVPVTLLILCVLSVIHNYKKRTFYYWTAGGAMGTIAMITTFVFVCDSRITRIEKLANQSVMNEGTELPLWVTLAQ
jgi:XrtN system VIT domain protein